MGSQQKRQNRRSILLNGWEECWGRIEQVRDCHAAVLRCGVLDRIPERLRWKRSFHGESQGTVHKPECPFG